MNRVWTEEELDILRRDRAEKVPVPVTAAKLGRPVPATYARARLIGTLVQPHQSWDEASVARLRELVSADPPMTDKRIAAELGRTVTQIRWKMQDLGLIGVRDLSKLAKITASESARPKPPASQPARKSAAQRPATVKAAPAEPMARERVEIPAQATIAPVPVDPRADFDRALKKLEAAFADRLKTSIAESEAGMVRAATDAIAEKGRIDQRLAALGRQFAQAQAERLPEMMRTEAEVRKADAAAEAKRKTEPVARKAGEEKPQAKKPLQTAPKPAAKKSVLPSIQGASQAAVVRSAPPPVVPSVPKIVVTEAPAAVRAEPCMDTSPAQVSGRGGWKSVRRDPARIMAQAKAKATNRADAVDLAQAAQAAIERFISERGVTRTETSGIQALVSRLQARGYIVVRDGDGWVVDQRHHLDSESALVSFAEARGITLNLAA